VTQSIAEARKWYEQAAAAGDEEAKRRLGTLAQSP
jgi:TPR repeat protein